MQNQHHDIPRDTHGCLPLHVDEEVTAEHFEGAWVWGRKLTKPEPKSMYADNQTDSQTGELSDDMVRWYPIPFLDEDWHVNLVLFVLLWAIAGVAEEQEERG